MNWKRTLTNLSERRMYGALLATFFRPPLRLSSIDWGREHVVLSSKQSTIAVGQFDPNVMPYMEYVYECLDNPFIPTIVCKKSARIGWTTVINIFRGKTIHTSPCNMLLGFATGGAVKKFATGQWKDFLKGTPILAKIINVGIAKNKESMYQFSFEGGQLNLYTLGAIVNQKGDNVPYIEIEEPDDVKDDVGGQGDTFDNLNQRMKLVPPTQRKFIFGGTPTIKDFSRVEEAIKASNWMVFKAKCHNKTCGELVSMDSSAFANLKWDDYENRYIHRIYGRSNPTTAMFFCPYCNTGWSFEQKVENIIEGKKYGFIDHTGNFSKGWHPKFPENTTEFGFDMSEMLGCIEFANNYSSLAGDYIKAQIALAKGDEGKMLSFTNNRMGATYAGGYSALETDEMVALRSNYPEGIAPYEALIPFIGVDVQHNRFAITIIAAGRNGNLYLVKWFEIFGNVFNWEDSVWQKLTDIVLEGIPHVTGKQLAIETTSIDSGDGKTVELVYRWVKMMNELYEKDVRATKGQRELKFSTDDIYNEPRDTYASNDRQVVRSLAETMGVPVYILGTHRCHDEILRRIMLNKQRDEKGNVIPKFDVFYFNEQSYGGYEEQLTSCRKIIDVTGNGTKEVYKLIPGKHCDALAATKGAYFSYYARRVREFTNAQWEALEAYIYG